MVPLRAIEYSNVIKLAKNGVNRIPRTRIARPYKSHCSVGAAIGRP